jgi:hypothetical protein
MGIGDWGLGIFNPKFPYEFRENEEFNSKINCIKK